MQTVSTLTQQNDSSFKFPIPKRKPHTQKNSNQQHPPRIKKPHNKLLRNIQNSIFKMSKFINNDIQK